MDPTRVQGKIGTKKKKSALSIILTVLIILILLPVVLAGGLYLYITFADFEYDDPLQVISSVAPMSFAERNSFDAANRTRTMSLDNSDLYYLTNESMPDLRLNDSVYVNAYRLSLEDKALYVQGKAYGINIPVKLTFDVAWENGSILLKAQGAYLGKLCISIPLKMIADKAQISLEYDLPLKDEHLFNGVTNVYLDEGKLKATYPVDKNFLKDGMDAWVYMKSASVYQKQSDELVRLMVELQKNWSEPNYIGNELDQFIKIFEQNPDAYQELVVNLLASSPANTARDYFAADEHNPKLMSRFYPGISKEAVEAARDRFTYEKNYNFLRKYAKEIDEQFGNKEITIKDREFVYMNNKKIMNVLEVYANEPEAREVFAEGTEYCAIYCEGADSRQKIGTGYYSCGTAFKFVSGKCAVVCKKDDKLVLTEITPEEYEDLASGKKSGYIVAFKG